MLAILNVFVTFEPRLLPKLELLLKFASISKLVGIYLFISSFTEFIALVKPSPRPKLILIPMPANTVEGD